MATKSIAWNTGSGNITLTYQGQGSGTMTAECDPNDVGSARSQVITVETTDGVVTRNLTVSQAACPVPVGTVLSYQYTGSVQSVTLPAGKYKLQCWGAQGGSVSGSYTATGAKGGYSEGILTLSSPTTVYVFVGGQGSNASTSTTGSMQNGGWNGGGGAPRVSSYSSGGYYGISYPRPGGGATDISTVTSDMSYSSYRNNRSAASLNARLIVAGGGAGASAYYYESTSETQLSPSTESGIYISYIELNLTKPHKGGLPSFSIYRYSVTAGYSYRVVIPAWVQNSKYYPIAFGNGFGSRIAIWPMDVSKTFSNCFINTSGGFVSNSALEVRDYEVVGGGIYAVSYGYSPGTQGIYVVNWFDSSGNFISGDLFKSESTEKIETEVMVTAPSNATHLYLNYLKGYAPNFDVESTGIELVNGSVYSGFYVGNGVAKSFDDYVTIPSGCSYLYLSIPNTLSSPTVTYTSQSSSYGTSNGSQVGGGTSGGGTSPGTQSGGGGELGKGASMTATNYRYASGGGGGGYYGGGASYDDSTTDKVNQSGGGSGFVSSQLDSRTTTAGSSSFPNTAGTGNETGHSGNGYAKITRLTVCPIILTFKTSGGVPVEGLTATVSLSGGSSHSITTDANGQAGFTDLAGTYTIATSEDYMFDQSTFTAVSGNVFVNIVVSDKTQWDYEYSGAVKSKTLKAGTYKIECWGAQGGSYNTTYYGGKGGYSVGKLTLESNTTVYVYVGGQGTGGSSSGNKAGGFNGGGKGYSTSATYLTGSGGGASDVRIGQDSLYARVIVAGGGGGFGSYNSTNSNRRVGGYGGGASGGSGGQYSTSYKAGTGGTQTAAGTSYYSTTSNSTTYGNLPAFGTGGASKSTSYQIAGGGGGWYGGGYAGRGGGAGGGSGYVYNADTAVNYPSGCLLNSAYYLADAETKDGGISMPSTSGSTETGHAGNGYVRITKI